MLTASLDGATFMACDADKGPDYFCRFCHERVVLKQGRVKVSHFAHMKGSRCPVSSGESEVHERGKLFFYNLFRQRGLSVSIEEPVAEGSQVADVLVSTQKHGRVAIEIQRASLDLDGIERRTKGYLNAGIAPLWVPVLHATPQPRIEKYSPRPFERWVHGFMFGKVLFYDPSDTAWIGHFDKYEIHRFASEYYDSYGDNQWSPGFSYYSKRWKTLSLEGPLGAEQIGFRIRTREEKTLAHYKFPSGRYVAVEAKA